MSKKLNECENWDLFFLRHLQEAKQKLVLRQRSARVQSVRVTISDDDAAVMSNLLPTSFGEAGKFSTAAF